MKHVRPFFGLPLILCGKKNACDREDLFGSFHAFPHPPHNTFPHSRTSLHIYSHLPPHFSPPLDLLTHLSSPHLAILPTQHLPSLPFTFHHTSYFPSPLHISPHLFPHFLHTSLHPPYFFPHLLLLPSPPPTFPSHLPSPPFTLLQTPLYIFPYTFTHIPLSSLHLPLISTYFPTPLLISPTRLYTPPLSPARLPPHPNTHTHTFRSPPTPQHISPHLSPPFAYLPIFPNVHLSQCSLVPVAPMLIGLKCPFAPKCPFPLMSICLSPHMPSMRICPIYPLAPKCLFAPYAHLSPSPHALNAQLSHIPI